MTKSVLKIHPIGEYIMVKPTLEKETTPSGLIIQTKGKGERPQEGEVVALGLGRLNEKGVRLPFGVSIGDIVYFEQYSPRSINVDGEEYLFMKEGDVMGIRA